ncbi:MAG TPA: signal peptidase I [Arthrobacter sp.]|jgi:signal peptidase I
MISNPLHRLPPRFHVAADWIVTLLVAVLFVLVFEAEVAKPYRIPSASMEPTLHCARPAEGCEAATSDRVIADRLAYRFHGPQRGDIVVFTAPSAAARQCQTGGTFVKRVVGLPGEQLSSRNGRVLVDGRPLDESAYLRAGVVTSLAPTKVPRDAYFVMGDNRGDSCDSRAWGAVPRRNVIGRVDLTYWPPTRLGLP